ncbi:MAG TPA: hypothetical protein VF621_08980 [Pyrinomonadaceae bacterium]
MTRPAAPLLSLLLALSVGAAGAARRKDERPKRGFTRDIPRHGWVPTYFEHIDKLAKRARLPTLRAPLREGETELRVWEIDNQIGAEGFRMKRTRAGWSASYYGPAYARGRDMGYERRLAEPRSGWEGAWDRLVGLGVLELPDAEGIGCIPFGVRDGHGYVVELNAEGAYRTYRYGNPEHAGCAEARRMVAIASAIVEEFGLKEIAPFED